MDYRALMVSTVLATGLVGLSGTGRADIIATENGIAVRDSDGTTPSRGMTMTQVASKFGDPVSKIPAVGNPPISRWEYPGFVVYFERDHVIHSVVSGSPAAPAAGSPAASPAPGADNSAPAAAPEPAGTSPTQTSPPPAT